MRTEDVRPLALLLAAVAVLLPGCWVAVTGGHPAPPIAAAIFGVAILGAAFLLTWAAEVAQLEISQALALAILAIVAVLPEYAVDIYFAWAAADRPEYARYATANMTGANRLLVGVGWPAIVLLFAARFRRSRLDLGPDRALEVAFLGIATAFAALVPLKGNISLWDAGVLVAIYGAYAWRTATARVEEPHLVGPAELLERLPVIPRRGVTVALFVIAGVAILLVAEPFAEALIESGAALGIQEYLLVQWVAPLASEAPEFVIACTWVLQGQAPAALTALISSKINQWTVLIGTLPVAYSLSGGRPQALPLDRMQMEEIWLTAAQSLFGTILLFSLGLGIGEAVLLLAVFLAQFFVPGIRIEATIAYVVLSIIYLYRYRDRVGAILRRGLVPRRP